ncbi:MAG: hypothetical protein RIT45_2103 [Pseudomonadota bacterium]
MRRTGLFAHRSSHSMPRLDALLIAALLLALATTAGCGGDGDGAPPGTADALADAGSDAAGDAGVDGTGDTGSDADVIDPNTYTWPVALEPVTVAPSSNWRADLTVPAAGSPFDPFVAMQQGEYGSLAPRWVKATIVLSDPEKVYFPEPSAEPEVADLYIMQDVVRALRTDGSVTPLPGAP